MSLPSYYITDATVIVHGVLHLTFADGTSGEVDVLDRMRGPVFERARTPEGFREAHIAEGTVAWPGGADLVARGTRYSPDRGTGIPQV